MRQIIHDTLTHIQHNQVVLNGMAITDEEMQDLASEIQSLCPEVQSIYLSNNHIGDKGAGYLSKALKELPHLSVLDLQFNDIDREGARAIMSLKVNHPGIIIALHGNKISDVAEMFAIEKEFKTE